MRKYMIVGVWCFVALMLVSCSPSRNKSGEGEGTAVAVPTVAASATPTQVEATVAAVTVPATPTQVEATVTPLSTATPVRDEESGRGGAMPSTEVIEPQLTATAAALSVGTPRPTGYAAFDIAYSDLSEEVATQNLIDLLATNRGCLLPCWWGIQLGQTNVSELESIFVPLGFDWNRDSDSLHENTIYKAYVSITAEEGVVQSINVWGGAGEETYDQNEAWRPYAIPQILEQYGVPEEVYVYYPFRFDPGGLSAYHLFLYYPDLGIEIDYLGKATVLDDRAGWAEACPNILETNDINLFLFQPAMVPNYRERTLPVSSLPLPELPEGTDPYDVVSWVESTQSSLAAFEQLFTEAEEGTVCFEFKTYWTGN